MKIESPNEWPFSVWPHFVELLRVFASNDEAQNAFFPVFEEARHFDLHEGGLSSEDAYVPTFVEMGYWAETLSFHLDMDGGSEEILDVLDKVALTFKNASEETSVKGRSIYHSRTDFEALQKLRPELRELCLKSLSILGEEMRAPQTAWNEMIIP